MRKLRGSTTAGALFGAAAIVGLMASVTPATAQDELIGSWEMPIGSVIFADPFSTHVLGSAGVPDEFVGGVCDVTFGSNNNESVHIGNDLVVESATSVTLPDAEGSPGKITTAEDQIVLGETATVTLFMGEEGIWSARSAVVYDCFAPVPPTTTTTEAPTTTTEAPVTTTSTGASPTTPPSSSTPPPTTTSTAVSPTPPPAPPATAAPGNPSFTG